MKKYFINRREKLIATLPNGCVALLFSGALKNMSNDLFYPFVVNKNFYYLTGINEDNCIYMIVKGESIYKELFFTEQRSKEKEKWIGERLKKEDIEEISGLSSIYSLNDFETVLSSYLNSNNVFGEIDSVYLDQDKFSSFDSLDKIYEKKIKDKYPNIFIRNIYNNIAKLRLIKDELEIENIVKAISITKNGIYEMMKNVNKCNYEYEVEAYYDYVLKSNNTIPSFKTICASGINSTILHYEENNCEIVGDSLILCDLGSLVNNYASDISRTFPKMGKFSDLQKKLYNVVLDTNKACINLLKPGVSRNDYEVLARDTLANGLLNLGLIKEKDEIDKYYYHSVGHMLGLDVHDVGKFDEFKEGMVVTCEPGIYIPELKIGIRIEDDILITKNGNINLSRDIIKEICDIEALMNS